MARLLFNLFGRRSREAHWEVQEVEEEPGQFIRINLFNLFKLFNLLMQLKRLTMLKRFIRINRPGSSLTSSGGGPGEAHWEVQEVHWEGFQIH